MIFYNMQGVKEERVHLNIVCAVSDRRRSTFAPEGHKRLGMNTIARLRMHGRVKSGLKRHTKSTQQLQSPESNLKSRPRKKLSTSGSNHDADKY